MDTLLNEANFILEKLKTLPTNWYGKECVLELKEADYNWRQMEWWAFYFEYKCKQLLKDTYINIPGDRIGNVSFDIKGSINWDFKASAIKTDNHRIILNDKIAMDESIKRENYHGEIIGLCDVEYNDVNRSFQLWHTYLKGGRSHYEEVRESRTSVSRYRKTKAILTELLFVVFDNNSIDDLSTMKQGRNSNGNPRKEKYQLNLEKVDNYLIKSYKF